MKELYGLKLEYNWNILPDGFDKSAGVLYVHKEKGWRYDNCLSTCNGMTFSDDNLHLTKVCQANFLRQHE